MTLDEKELLDRVNHLIEPHKCRAIEIGPDSVGVKGDARAYGPSVFVRFPPYMSPEQVKVISTEITNKIPEISRVLQEILPPETQSPKYD